MTSAGNGCTNGTKLVTNVVNATSQKASCFVQCSSGYRATLSVARLSRVFVRALLKKVHKYNIRISVRSVRTRISIISFSYSNTLQESQSHRLLIPQENYSKIKLEYKLDYEEN